ncbi:hypothetical protein AVEN_15939-1, partial [Araneus ventricosus]
MDSAKQDQCTEMQSLSAESVKPRSYGLSFHEFRQWFALFPVVGTERIDVARGIASAPVVSRVMG